jgi:regulatory Fis family protein
MKTTTSEVPSKEEQARAAYEKNGGNIRATAKELGIERSTLRDRLKKIGGIKKPIAGGAIRGIVRKRALLPASGEVRRYLLTSAQNNTYIHKPLWDNLLALAAHYKADILVGTYSYNQNGFGKLAVKRGTKKAHESTLWYDSNVLPFICDKRIELGNDLVWCGEMNITPTAGNPLSGLETYSHYKSAIFPHSRLEMRSIAVMQGDAVKFNYTTGTVTLMNYIQKKEGLKAEHHHSYSALLVEVDHSGTWFVRQVNADSQSGTIQDLDVIVENGKVTTGNHIEAITWGDLHAASADPKVLAASMDMLDTLKPKHQFLHDIMEGCSISHHSSTDPHVKFYVWLRGLHRLEAELEVTKNCVEMYDRQGCSTVVVDSNHDAAWLLRWLREYDYRKDPANTEIFLRAQSFVFKELRRKIMPRDVNILEWFMKDANLKTKVKFLRSDKSYLICNNQIQCGMHGHFGPNGTRGMPISLSKVGRKANTMHTHSAGIFSGLYVGGLSAVTRWEYNRGPSSWSHSHILNYPSGKRAIVTMSAEGKWRA